MATRSDEEKELIIQRLARFDTPQDGADDVSVEFGIKIDRHQVQSYDPTKKRGRDLGDATIC
jgi:hypothetical protein